MKCTILALQDLFGRRIVRSQHWRFFTDPVHKYSLFLVSVLLLFGSSALAQVHTQIVGDSVRIHSNNGMGELILENSTKNTSGFLFNKGNGRTEFRKALTKLDDSTYVIGADTLHISNGSAVLNAKDGVVRNANDLFLGNTTSGSGPHNFTTNRYQYLNGNFYSIGGTTRSPENRPVFRFYNNGDFVSGSENNLTGNLVGPNNGIRYTSKYGLFEVGTDNNFDTSISTQCCGSKAKSAIVINSDFINTITGDLHGSIVGGDGMHLQSVAWSSVFGESHNMYGGGFINKSLVGGYAHQISAEMMMDVISGQTHVLGYYFRNSMISGFANSLADTTGYSIIGGALNTSGGNGQIVAGMGHVMRTPYGAAFGLKSVNFTSLDFKGGLHKSLDSLEFIPNLGDYPLFALGNSRYFVNTTNPATSSRHSNALTVLYNGRTQINTTGFDNNLTESDVKPKAALEVVSTNSGVLLPKLTTTQRNGIATTDLYDGLLLYNTDSSLFQYYSGSAWKNLAAQDAPLAGQVTIDFPSTSGGTSSESTLTITGAADGDVVTLGVPNNVVAGNSCYTAWVSATNTVTIRFNNYGSTAIDPPSGLFKIKVIK